VRTPISRAAQGSSLAARHLGAPGAAGNPRTGHRNIGPTGARGRCPLGQRSGTGVCRLSATQQADRAAGEMSRLLALLAAISTVACGPEPFGTEVIFVPTSADGRADSTINLAGTFRLPSAADGAPLPAIVLVHGLSADRSQFDFLADSLLA